MQKKGCEKMTHMISEIFKFEIWIGVDGDLSDTIYVIKK